MEQKKEGRLTDMLNVMVIDEDRRHAYSTSSMLTQFNFCVTVYTSPIKALDFLENHAQDFDLVLAEVHMEELNGFAFLTASRKIHKSIQVIMMSTETTMCTMKRCVQLGARFLVKKPLDFETTQNIWQHLDLKVVRMEKIKGLLQDDSSKNTKVIKNKGTTDCNQIATHVHQGRQLHLEKEVSNALFTNKSRKGASSSRRQRHQFHPSTQLAKTTMQVLNGDDVYTAMRRSLHLGTIFDESNYSNDPCSNEYKVGEDEIGGYGCANEANATHSSDDHNVVVPDLSCNIADDVSQEIMSKATTCVDHRKQDTTRTDGPAAMSADEANATFSTGNLQQVNVIVTCNGDGSQESIQKNTCDDQHAPTGSKPETFRLVNYSDSESD
ncbi:two-component response regulator ORR29-like [Oryza sativa Japonica Group]|nr:hypothetical protein DAI22_04g086100 [Oryza sativa Japonica Group]